MSYAPKPPTNQALHYGDSRTAIAWIVPDAKYPGVMWRIRWPDGRLSEMANLTRAKDAAMAICERGPPRRNARLLRWKHTRESPSAPRTRGRAAAPTSTAPRH
jgi:hypothetical protein